MRVGSSLRRPPHRASSALRTASGSGSAARPAPRPPGCAGRSPGPAAPAPGAGRRRRRPPARRPAPPGRGTRLRIVSKSRAAAECPLASPAPTCPAWCGGQPRPRLGDDVVDDGRDRPARPAPRRTPARRPRRSARAPARPPGRRTAASTRARAATRDRSPPARAAARAPPASRAGAGCARPPRPPCSGPPASSGIAPAHGGRERVGLRQVGPVQRGDVAGHGRAHVLRIRHRDRPRSAIRNGCLPSGTLGGLASAVKEPPTREDRAWGSSASPTSTSARPTSTWPPRTTPR